ncbi:copper-binding protein [Variovorax sp. AFSI2.2]|uniref:copper-binding protein n=1 Tax=Variovorax sp. AFSI2.2 TaxID=3384160 RepID=UPI003EB9D431
MQHFRGRKSGAASNLARPATARRYVRARSSGVKHGPLNNLNMPGMTMVFGVKDDAMLDKLETGAKVRFQAEKIDGKIVVTKIETAR